MAEAGVACTPGNHGISIFKACTSPKNRCTTDADCSDGTFCNGAEQCATEGAPGSNVVDCTITISNPLSHCDSSTVTEISDAILNGTGAPTTSSDLLVTTSSGGTGPGCDAGSNLGGTETCTLAPGGSITVRANYYVIQVADPDPLNDQATGTVVDTCDCPELTCPGGSPGCSSTPNNVQFTAATTTVSGCGPGTPVDCPDDGLFCNGTEFCDEAADACGHQNPPACGDDGLFCNGTEFCDEAADACGHQNPPSCPDDGDACNGPEFCNEEIDACDSGPDVVCQDPTCTVCNPATGACDPIDPLPAECQEPVGGRMTGGGSVFTKGGQRVTHGFELHCDVEVAPNNLEINWGPGNHFHLEELLTATCIDDPNIAPPPPQAGFDTYIGTGTGSCNGVPGATITFTLTDAGEPGKLDTATFDINGCPDGLTLSVTGNLKKGNQQAHRD